MKKILCGLLAATLAVTTLPQGVIKLNAEASKMLFINEVMSSNTCVIRDGDFDDSKYGIDGGAYSDWIEIFNSSDLEIDLTGYTLSDSSAKWTFPKCSIPARGYLIVWASDKNKVANGGQLHTNFKISASGELLALRNVSGDLVDEIEVPVIKDDESYGRKTDGNNNWVVFSKSSPLATNSNSTISLVVKDPVFSHKGGFYSSGFDLTLNSNDSETKIYYTLDGSDPDPKNQSTYEYKGPINVKSRSGEPNILSMIKNISNDQWNKWQEPLGEVFKCSTIKAVVIRQDGARSKIVTNSYFVDKNMNSRYSVPVISLVTDKTNLFDDTKGIYVNENYEKKGDEWERPVHIEFYENDGTLAFSQYSGLRINGGYSRKIPQKSFRLYADHGYDDNTKYKYEVFPGLKKKGNGKKLDSFSRLILRNAGNDCSWTGVFFRDAFMQDLVSHLSLDTMAYRPSVVFLNGEYWGLYNIRERYDGEYFESHYNIDKDKAVILDVWNSPDLQNGEPGDEKLYQDEIINYLKTNSITDKETYEYINTKMDIQNYIEYNVAEIFYGNYDWPGNNMSIWKYKTADGKYHPEASYGQDGRWRWLLRDTDFGLGYLQKSADFNTLEYATADVPEVGDFSYANQPWAVFLLKTLLKNTEFRNQFINSFADQMNTSFQSDRVKQKLNEFKNRIEAEVPENCDRWRILSIDSPYNGLNWYENIEYIEEFVDKRPDFVREHIKNKFKNEGIEGISSIKLETDIDKGYIKINSIDIRSSTPGVTDPSSWTGIYFQGLPITLTATPQKGYTFDHWETKTGVEATKSTITFNLNENVHIKAIFKPDNSLVTPTPQKSMKISGYIVPDLTSYASDIKSGFKVELAGEGMYAYTNSEGFFELKEIPENATGYDIRISKDNYLSRQIKNIVIKDDLVLSLKDKPINIWAGDIKINGVQDNNINMVDVMQIAKTFGNVKGDSAFNENVDLNKDDSVNISDVMIIARHFNSDISSY